MGWSAKVPICTSWVGVNCSSSSDGSRRLRRRVVGVNLGGFGIRGAIPEKTIGRLDALEALFLENNCLTGAIPADLTIGNLPNLKRLNLSNNRLNGSIPPSLISRFPPPSFGNYDKSLQCGPPLNHHHSSPLLLHPNPEKQPLIPGLSVDHHFAVSRRLSEREKSKLKNGIIILCSVVGGLALLSAICCCIRQRWCKPTPPASNRQ
ncbi:unnamed protein product [Cuscuta epithymum]|uniref:Leucine-rich repeat-containing N-terminal plant-type domain-containing protein n=1 Tax=Cuscuta epithymum TaxID=186058 RepID=A0AAV0GEY6_9ASTE|nr:unnamed protein product [Cuscuta epithymum]